MHLYEVFGSDQLLNYLANSRQSPTCTITKDSDRFYLGSAYIDALVATGRLGRGAGLESVLKLIDPKFDKRAHDEKARICVEGILCILNGIISTKYNHHGLQRAQVTASGTTKIGAILNITKEKKIYTATKDTQMRINVQASYDDFEERDKQPYTAMQIWEIARNNGYVARALYYYAKSSNEDRYNLNKVKEEIEHDIGYSGLVGLVGKHNVEAFQEWVNDPSISGGEARHSKGWNIDFIKQYFREHKRNYKNTMAPGSSCPINFRELLLKWINTKRTEI